MTSFISELTLREKLAGFIAVSADLIDFVGGAIPFLGEPMDVFVALINGYLMKNPRTLLGMGEILSVFPPAALLDFVPVHSIGWYMAAKDNHK